MVSFEVKNLFTQVPLSETIDIILTKIYDENKIDTKTYTKVNTKRVTVSLHEACTLHTN